MMIREVEFHGPYPLGAEIPSGPGIYLVCTESSGGIRILGVYESDDMGASISGNPWKSEWNNYEDNNGLFVYWSDRIDDEGKRSDKVWDIVNSRPYKIPCVTARKDDW